MTAEYEFTEQSIQDRHWFKDKRKRRKPDHSVVAATFNPLAEFCASFIENPGNASVLDVGCGNGFLQYALEQKFGLVTGLDYSEPMLKVNPCRKKLLGSAMNLPFDDKSFDIVVASNLLHHLVESDRMCALAEMRRVARSAVISFEPNRNNPLVLIFSMIKKEERMALRFSTGYMRKLFLQTGLTSVHVHVEGWIVPNKAPDWWVPIGRFIGMTPLRAAGFDICTAGVP